MPLHQRATLKTMVANATTAATETTLDAFEKDAAPGEVIAVNSDGTAISSASTKIMIVSKNDDGTLNVSEVIDVASIKKVSAKPFAEEKEQIDYVGFNGTSGSIDVINNNQYQVRIEFADYGSTGTELRYRKHGFYNSTSSANQLGIAEGLRDSLIRNFSREPQQYLKFEVVCSNAGTALATGVDDVVFTKGSRTISATDIDNATGNAALAVGDLLRVGTAVTDPVYRITAIDASANTAKLDKEFQGATVTIADTGLERIPVADQAAANYGVKISGQPLRFVLGKIRFGKIRFVTQMVDSGITGVTTSQTPSLGFGAGKLVAEEEWFTIGNYGELYRTGEPDLYDTESLRFASITGKYDCVSLEYVHKEETAFQDQILRRNINVYGSAGSNGTTHTNINVLITDLNTLSSVSLSTL